VFNATYLFILILLHIWSNNKYIYEVLISYHSCTPIYAGLNIFIHQVLAAAAYSEWYVEAN